MLELGFDLADLAHQFGPPLQLGRRVGRDRGLVVVVQEGEQPVILFLRQRVELVAVALGTLNRQAEDAFADRVHPVEHRFHPELFGIDATFLVDHRVPQVAGGDLLVLGGRGQLVAGQLLDDELVVGQVAVQGATTQSR